MARISVSDRCQQVLPVKQHFAAFDPARRLRDQAHDGIAGDRLAAARFADNAQRFAPVDLQKLIFCAARTTPLRRWNEVDRLRTSSSAIGSVLRALGIEGIAQPVTQEVQRKQRQREEEGGEHQQPWEDFHVLLPFIDQHAP